MTARRPGAGLRNGAAAALAALLLTAFAAPAWCATAAPEKNDPAAILPGGNSKAPISIDADKLVYFDKEQKAIYSGNVIAIQGDSKLTCSVLTIYLDRTPEGAAGAAGAPATAAPAPTVAPANASAAGANAAPAGGPGSSTSQVKHMDAVGPVTIVSKTQVATGDRGSYDKPENKVYLFGHVTLSDSGNVTKGDKLVYDMTTGQAVVLVGKSSPRVHGLFIPSSNSASDDKSTTQKKKAPDNARKR